MSIGGTSNPVGTNGTLNAPGSGGITDAPFYGTAMQQFADPLHLFPSPTADNSAPGILPNLGPASMLPNAPRGAFQQVPGGGGPFNSMAAMLAGPLFNPSVVPPQIRVPTRTIPRQSWVAALMQGGK